MNITEDKLFGLKAKKATDAPWHDYGYGHIDLDSDLCIKGFITKSILEKRTLRKAEMSTSLTLDQVNEILFKDNEYYAVYSYTSEDQDVEIKDRYDGPESVVDNEDPTQKCMYSANDGTAFIYYTRGKSYTDVKTYISIATTDEKKLSLFKEMFKPFRAVLSKKVEGVVHMMLSKQDQIIIQKTGKITCPINREYYSKDVQESFDFILEEFKKEIPRGKITILSGPPGTGKTYLIRSLITEGSKYCSFVIVPPSLVSKLGEPEMLPALLEHKNEKKPLVLILEDADILVKERLKDSIDAISAALNMGDGILGDICNIRLVITTNQPITEIDDAMKRPGRLSRSCVVGSLTGEEIGLAWAKMTNNKEMPEELKQKQTASIAELFQFKAILEVDLTEEPKEPTVETAKVASLGRRKIKKVKVCE